MSPSGTPRARRAQAALIAGWIGLIALFVPLVRAALPPGGLAWAIAALAAVPLAATLPGLLRGGRRTAVWANILLAPYLGYALMEVIANPGVRLLATLTLATAFASFVLVIAFLRSSRT